MMNTITTKEAAQLVRRELGQRARQLELAVLENESEGKRGQAYNLNIAVSDFLVPDGRGNWHISPKCYTRQLLLPHSTTPFHSSFKLKYPPCPFLSLQKSPQTCLNRIHRAL